MENKKIFENQLMRILGNRDKFFKFYFKELGKRENGELKHKTNEAAFEYVNDLYFSFFEEPRYVSYGSFRRAHNNHIRKTR